MNEPKVLADRQSGGPSPGVQGERGRRALANYIGLAFQGGRSADEALQRAETRIIAMQQGGG
ncbi:hypothetical protein WJ0W_000130 [Paenibacillus melissococcoides]|uniref:Uncharacterized protein n=1 Tax=Paenibacillus melissococcoides TaxID=2912268 RepID=A0ABM9FUW6_9BACL|nr:MULTISPECIES: hypothetical protein [Paenibacillus]MEB9896023.1 hypothetical protein [Bacillus cereus]CAH8242921.1 hypothetical protein WJ0W_000130 [Paenibacillus melissococcoides]CAH8703398.1 hypothetical protein WDD9_000127 [Paenibacillus melissococcoides]CAH8706258.1 hypothetical protein HTL2_001211 [Paenibacillus melissococcoides]GIO81450.1 hypothetical protein J6TS7_50600 [Paenibacillus dendritiformis]